MQTPDKCRFTHDQPGYSNEICQSWVKTGKCRNGDHCPDLHPLDDQGKGAKNGGFDCSNDSDSQSQGSGYERQSRKEKDKKAP